MEKIRTSILKEAIRVQNITAHAIKSICFGDEFIATVQHISETRGCIFLLGVGKSGIIAQKISATFASLGIRSFYIHPTEALHGDMGRIQEHDTVIALSHSGTTIELLEALDALQQRSITLIAITGNKESLLAQRADYTLYSGIEQEACSWNIVPTTSLMTALLIGDALALCVVHEKKIEKSNFAKNHPKGALGSLLNNLVHNAMQTEDLPLIHEHAPLVEGISILHHGNKGAVFVVDDNKRLQGIITDGDIRRLILQGDVQRNREIQYYMVTNPKVGNSAMTTAELLYIMESHAITILPIVDEENKVIGSVHIHDILDRGNVIFK